ncbi:MAG: hypothetical protein KKF12_22810 [Proteobacteria bacterium]|nr:hypothetical protein [Pseudomonadota bacterium]
MRIKNFLILTMAIASIVINYNIAFSSEDETVFNPIFYLRANPDLVAAGYTEGNVVYHWINNGIHEGRQGSSTFDVHFYLQKYADLQQVFGSNYHAATIHWINNGIYEGRDPGALHGIKITGTTNFITQTEQALNLLNFNAPDAYIKVKNYITQLSEE